MILYCFLLLRFDAHRFIVLKQILHIIAIPAIHRSSHNYRSDRSNVQLHYRIVFNGASSPLRTRDLSSCSMRLSKIDGYAFLQFAKFRTQTSLSLMHELLFSLLFNCVDVLNYSFNLMFFMNTIILRSRTVKLLFRHHCRLCNIWSVTVGKCYCRLYTEF